jgi:hypothetical protein
VLGEGPKGEVEGYVDVCEWVEKCAQTANQVPHHHTTNCKCTIYHIQQVIIYAGTETHTHA